MFSGWVSLIFPSETNISTLASRLEDKDAKLATAERSYKSAEVNLSLQEAQHNREVSQLQRELNALKARPDLTAVTEELEQRNTEMEELLREKCREIEENDDRSLEWVTTRLMIHRLISH